MSSEDGQTAALAATNQKLGAFPVVTMANGQKVPTGTVGTLLYNIKAYNTSSSNEEKEKLEKEIKSAVPVLGKIGFFELFSTDEWVRGESEGRRLVGEEGRRLGF